jgi:hypothetical protein
MKAELGDFFNLEPLLITYQELHTLNMVTQTQSAYVTYYTEQFASYSRDNNLVRDNNQILSRASGVALALNVFPDDPDYQQWVHYVTEVWHYWQPQQDIFEDAGTYNAIDLYELVQLAMFLQHANVGQNTTLSGARQMFNRYRDQLSTSGAMPQYGDDYFSEAWPIWTSIYEYAARLYNDPTFLGAANAAFWFGLHNYQPVASTASHDLKTLSAYYYQAQILSLNPFPQRVEITRTHSEISTRNDPLPGFHNTPNMLIMSPSRRNDAPYVMMELHARGFHAQQNRRGTIQFYGNNGIPFYHGLNRHNNSAIDGNITALLPPDEQFPRPVTRDSVTELSGQPDTWNHETVAAATLAPISATNPNQVQINRFTLRVSLPPDVNNASLIIDNLRLVGPSGSRHIDDFENLDNWQRQDQPYSLTTDHTQGNTAMQVHLVAGASIFYTSNEFNLIFNTKEYPIIMYDWKYVYPTTIKLSFTFRISQPGEDNDTTPSDVNIAPTITNSSVVDCNQDAHAQVAMNEYFTYDSTIERNIVLTQEGFLVIQDTLIPGKSADGYNAGPIWQLYSLAQQGSNWFDSPGETHQWYSDDQAGQPIPKRSLLVYFAPASGRTFGHEQGPPIPKSLLGTNLSEVVQTVYARQRATAHVPIQFLTVLIPHNPLIAASTIASAIAVQHDMHTTIVTIKWQGKTSRIFLGTHQSWKVTR